MAVVHAIFLDTVFIYCAGCYACSIFHFPITLGHKIYSIVQEKIEIHLADSWECSFKGQSDFKACALFRWSVMGGSE